MLTELDICRSFCQMNTLFHQPHDQRFDFFLRFAQNPGNIDRVDFRFNPPDTAAVSYTHLGNATIDVKGLLNGTPMNISGTINPFESKLKLAMKGEVTSLSLPAFSPFSAKFTGHPIEKVLLTYKGTFDINQDKLTSENALVINKLEFGSQVPDAKDALPVGLAVSLLQDRQGQIDLNIPVSGSLDDPEFLSLIHIFHAGTGLLFNVVVVETVRIIDCVVDLLALQNGASLHFLDAAFGKQPFAD